MPSATTHIDPLDNEPASQRPRYTLRSDLARSCLPGSRQGESLHLIWINTVCGLFLLVGLLGWQRPVGAFFDLSSSATKPILPVVFTPPPDSREPLAQTSPDSETTPPDLIETLSVPAVVAPATAEVAFPVAITGPTIEVQSVELAALPPLDATPASPSPLTGPQVFRPGQGTPDGGFYPDPEYPRDALLRREQGQTQIFIEVGEDGRVLRTEVRVSSGFASLDRHTLSHVRRFWRFPPGARREYLWTAEYVLR